jgi:hypothetical protein
LKDDEQAGWGEATGFNIDQMPASFVLYAGVPGISGHMVFHFETGEKMGAKGYIQILYPPEYQVQCEGEFFKKLTLPGWVTCDDNVYATRSRISMNNTLNPGAYAFIVTGTALPNAPNHALFHLQLLDSNEQVHDGAMNLPGQKISTDPSVAALPFVWSNSEPKRPAVITMGFDVLSKATQNVSGLLFNLPPGFQHQVDRPSDFRVRSPFLATNTSRDRFGDPTGESWLDWRSSKETFRIFLDASTLMEKGQYEFEFPVMVPAKIPSFNAWTLSLCQVPVCESRSDPNVLVTIPVAGFNHGERHPDWNRHATAGAHDAHSALLRVAWLLCLLSIAEIHLL